MIGILGTELIGEVIMGERSLGGNGCINSRASVRAFFLSYLPLNDALTHILGLLGLSKCISAFKPPARFCCLSVQR